MRTYEKLEKASALDSRDVSSKLARYATAACSIWGKACVRPPGFVEYMDEAGLCGPSELGIFHELDDE